MSERHLNELILRHKERQSHQVRRDFNILASVSGELLLTDTPKDGSLEEGLHGGQDEKKDNRNGVSPDVHHKALVEEPPLSAEGDFALRRDQGEPSVELALPVVLLFLIQHEVFFLVLVAV